MSAICGNVSLEDWRKALTSDGDTPVWPHQIKWSNDGMTVMAVVDGDWSGSNDGGFNMSTIAAGAGTIFTFNFADADDGYVEVPLTLTADGISTEVSIYLCKNVPPPDLQ